MSDKLFDTKAPTTTSSGAPAVSDRNSLTIGADGPIVLHDVHFLEQMAHFNREKVIERQPHAKGSGAFGVFETTADVSKYTKAALFQPGVKTEMLARFSTVAGEHGSPDTWRDVRGFSLKFYTTEGNYDLVGNNTPVFFVRDPMKFPHFIRSQKRLPDSGLRDNHMQWDFWTSNPESAHQVTYLMGPRGLPRTWREMNGYGSHTYMWVNAQGERFWVKYHFHSKQGVAYFSNAEAANMAGADADFHRRDLFESIQQGACPSWEMSVQIMPYADAAKYRFNPFDLTKTWSHKDYPLIKVGTMTLNRNPENFFAQIEQAAFSPGNTVPGIGLSPDKMLLGRAFAYNDAQRNRIGTNFHQLPVNQPKVPVNTYMIDGPMNYHHTGAAPVYVPNSGGRPWSDETGKIDNGWEADGDMVRSAYTLHAEDDDFGQPGTLVRHVFSDADRDALVETVSGSLLAGVREPVLSRAFEYWKNIDPTVGQRIQDKVTQAAKAKK
ncbi:catalase [Bordetella trematum]|uniref:Catalase n=1 Tax=Bordetella trematum TaxID=123899 RepID=A0A157S912_9BORD|nr:catalase [Bordetella trematum]AUL48305.1 catalase [Bordetella trematum]AZR95267.1 catalase [Bordetella trematum]NNH18189.1 catalase [Bordetella trematum]SAI49419.1 catalase [Bordetella trematum]SAI58961.1 catalase [Bordetella trematum]